MAAHVRIKQQEAAIADTSTALEAARRQITQLQSRYGEPRVAEAAMGGMTDAQLKEHAAQLRTLADLAALAGSQLTRRAEQSL